MEHLFLFLLLSNVCFFCKKKKIALMIMSFEYDAENAKYLGERDEKLFHKSFHFLPLVDIGHGMLLLMN